MGVLKMRLTHTAPLKNCKILNTYSMKNDEPRYNEL